LAITVIKTKSRNFGLDIIRAFSIWLVLLQHAGITATGFNTLKIGLVGVEVFFVLSGFLIGGILFREFEKENSFASIKRFWIRRWFRILPVYYLFLFIKFCIDPSVGSNIFYYIFFLQNNFGPIGISFYGVTWSLVIEEWFYIVAPIFIMIAYKLTKNMKLVSLFLLAFIIFENIIRYAYVTHGDIPYGGVNGNVPFRFDSLFIGMTLAFIKHHFSDIFKKLQSPWVLATGVIGLLVYLRYIFNISYPIDNFADYLFPRTIGFFLLSFLIALLIPFFYTINSINTKSVFNKVFYWFVHWTSLLTYSIYLVHMLFFSKIINNDSFSNSYVIQVCLSVVLTYVTSYIVYKYFEKPVLNLRERFS
jgi:peptidoglycan/LPS O-acetylase OafA/YrhL